MHFDHCENFLWKRYKLSIAEIFWGQHETQEVHRTLYSQTAIFVMEYCLMELWKCWGIKPNFVLGHSLGEFCAAVCAGILTLKEALTLVVERSRLIDQLPGGKMLVVKADEFTVKNLIQEFVALKGSNTWLDYAAINSSEQTVLAGDSDTIIEFAEFLQGPEKAIKCSILQSTHAFHSRHMEPMLQKYRNIAEKIRYNKPDDSCTFISGMLGKILNGISAEVDANYWVQHTRERVQFFNASKVAYNEGGCRTFLEIGPHPVLMTLTAWNNEGKNMLCLPSLRRNEENWRTMLSSLGKLFVTGGIEPDWERFDQFYQRKKVGHILPHYPFIGTKCWPNITFHHGTQIHPLLGSAISKPTHTKLFHSQLSVQEVEYLKDHVIGNMTVFPGAGYIEMLLTAGFITLEGVTSEFRLPRRPIVLQNFRIEPPLGLEEGGQGCQCQTVVNYDAQGNSDEYDVKIYHELRDEEGGSEWVRHASGSFLISSLDLKKTMDEADIQLLECDQATYFSIIETLKSTCKEESISKEFYDKTEEVGLKFGPSFRTLQKVWRKDKKDFLAEVAIPKDFSSYLLHPTLIDAMIQVAVFHSGSLEQTKVEKKLRVPIACEKFIWLKPLKTVEPLTPFKSDTATEANSEAHVNTCYIYSTSTNPKTIMMLDKNGSPITALVGVEVIETNVKTIKAMLETQVKALPDFYSMDWKPTTCPNQNRADNSIINIRVEELADQHFKLDNSGKDVAAKKSLDTLSCYYITNAFLSLGWSPKMNEKVRLDDICKELGILPQHKQLMRQFLIILQEDGILETIIPTTGNDIGERQWAVRTLPASKEELTSKAEEITRYCTSNNMDTNSVNGEFLLLQSVGEKLDKILTGNESALKILFPEDESKPSAAKFYQSWYKKVRASMYGTWCSVWKEVRANYEAKSLPMPTFRILEIGAGTGSGTEILISSLEDSEVPYEYVFTDISRAFFASTEKKFEKSKKSMKFRTLNIEQDPSSQGFPPKYFDFVFAADVLHATRDIRESLLNIRQVLRDTGYLWLSELPEANRVVDCIFGLLEGYWRFTDFELRPHHPLPSQEKWIRVGKEMGFCEVAYRRNLTTSVISFRADDGGKQSSYEELSKTLNPAMKNIHKEAPVTWLIFHDGTELDYVLEMKARFELLGRKKVILVGHSSLQDFTGEEFLIRPDKKQDMDDLFDLLFKGKQEGRELGALTEVEGMLVSWGLNEGMRDQTKIAQPFLYLIQNLVKLKTKLLPQLILLTSALYPVGDICCENPSGSSLIGIIKSAVNEHADIRFKGIDVNPTDLKSNADEIFQEIFNCCYDQSLLTAYRGHVRHVTKLIPDKFRSRTLPLPVGTDRFQLIHPKSRSIQDLEFGDLPPFALKPDEIEVRVKCFALNFKDIFTVLKPAEPFEKDDQVGLDFSGVVTQLGSDVTEWKVGDAVVGINLNRLALPSHLHLPQHAVKAIPPEFTFAESACVPAVFSTAHVCLVETAKMKEGETLLIHTASGGVGLVAIQLAKYYGVKIIATAGSHRKRAYLRSIGIQHVYHSRNTSYKNEILSLTNGHGVDIVLNSLTGPDFKEATLDVLTKGGRFVEMSKLNTWTKEEVSQRRPDVEYTIVDLSELDEKTSRELLEVQNDFVMKGNLKAIPYTRFDAVDIRDALTYLQKAQHIGKVVCVMPEEQKMEKASTLMSQFTSLFNDRRTYMITGGLGGIGMEVCKYMIEQGAKHVVLVGRTAPTDKSVAILDSLRKTAACNISVVQADIGDWMDCQRIFQEIDKLPPLRGIMHAAGALSDGLIENQTWENFQNTFRSKVDGSWNLHQLTKDKVLEHFVLFSSVASTLGSPGQTTHVSACAFEDGLAHFRNSHGLAATTINWGQFGQVGVAAEKEVVAIRPFSVLQGINALDRILRSNRNHITVASFEDALAASTKYFPFMKTVIDESVFKMREIESSRKALHMSSSQFWEEYNDCKDDRDGKVEVLKKYTKIALRHVLRLEQDDPIDENTELQDMGVDSLMMLELKNHVQEFLGERISITQSAVKDCTNVKLLANRLVEIIEEEGVFRSSTPPTFEKIREMILQDSQLPDNIQIEVPGSDRKPSQIRRVLLTGPTGMVGSHILRELLEGFQCQQLEKIYCLIRPRSGMEESPDDRLRSVLNKNGILPLITSFDRVQCIQGNLVEARLGLAEDEYDALSKEVDAVIHCGAKVSHTEFYRDVPGGRNDVRNVNVRGLLNVLEFACRKRVKHIINASTIMAVDSTNEGGCVLEDWPDVEELEVVTNRGYFVSKYVCELLLKQANERGLPCKSFKYAELRGSVATGKSLTEQSHSMKSFLFFLKEGIMPSTPSPLNFVPIDLAARITAAVMTDDEAPTGTYNVFHPRPQLLQECFPVIAREMGYSIEVVESEEYRRRVLERLKRAETEDDGGRSKAILSEFTNVYEDDDSVSENILRSTRVVQKYFENAEEFFVSKKLVKLVPELYSGMESSHEILKRDLNAAKNEGLFEKFGL